MPKKTEFDECITITFGDSAENHVGMQQIGTSIDSGFNEVDLLRMADYFSEKKCKVVLKPLHTIAKPIIDEVAEPAYILIVKGAVDFADELYLEQTKLDYDTKAFMRGEVKNKQARYNLCFGEQNQEPDYENKKGRIYSFDQIPKLKILKEELETISRKRLVAEGNYYFDLDKCGICYHGDTERKIVIAVRLYGKRDSNGKRTPSCRVEAPINYAWFHRYKCVSEIMSFDLSHGDIYIMSEKAVGNDWKKSSILTLRHSAGITDKYIFPKI